MRAHNKLRRHGELLVLCRWSCGDVLQGSIFPAVCFSAQNDAASCSGYYCSMLICVYVLLCGVLLLVSMPGGCCFA